MRQAGSGCAGSAAASACVLRAPLSALIEPGCLGVAHWDWCEQASRRHGQPAHLLLDAGTSDCVCPPNFEFRWVEAQFSC